MPSVDLLLRFWLTFPHSFNCEEFYRFQFILLDVGFEQRVGDFYGFGVNRQNPAGFLTDDESIHGFAVCRGKNLAIFQQDLQQSIPSQSGKRVIEIA